MVVNLLVTANLKNHNIYQNHIQTIGYLIGLVGATIGFCFVWVSPGGAIVVLGLKSYWIMVDIKNTK